jgi:hypothetical protein
MKELFELIYPILEIKNYSTRPMIQIGKSRRGLPLLGFKKGKGSHHLSLIAGCHSDEPAGPILLNKLVTFLNELNYEHILLQKFTWTIIPHANPDGELINRKWYSENDRIIGLAENILHSFREKPGDDLEFGFPDPKTPALRPENEAIYNFWKAAESNFLIHISLHGMNRSFGPWFLIDRLWENRSEHIRKACKVKANELGYRLHDLDRKGEKGFYRFEAGFASRPDSWEMKKHFLERNDEDTASKFHPSSMESIRSLGEDCLTLVSEMPLFILPDPPADISWPNPVWDRWSYQFASWKAELESGKKTATEVETEAAHAGIKPMPLKDQMLLQWQFFASGVIQALKETT